MIEIREASAADAHQIAAIRIAGWRAGYPGLVDGSHLAALDVESEGRRRAENWAAHQDGGIDQLLASLDGTPAGFLVAGPSRDDDHDDHELHALYVHPDHWRAGVARALVGELDRRIRALGQIRVRVWCLADNARGLGFYRALGWRDDGAHQELAGLGVDGSALSEIRLVRELTSGP